MFSQQHVEISRGGWVGVAGCVCIVCMGLWPLTVVTRPPGPWADTEGWTLVILSLVIVTVETVGPHHLLLARGRCYLEKCSWNFCCYIMRTAYRCNHSAIIVITPHYSTLSGTRSIFQFDHTHNIMLYFVEAFSKELNFIFLILNNPTILNVSIWYDTTTIISTWSDPLLQFF